MTDSTWPDGSPFTPRTLAAAMAGAAIEFITEPETWPVFEAWLRSKILSTPSQQSLQYLLTKGPRVWTNAGHEVWLTAKLVSVADKKAAS